MRSRPIRFQPVVAAFAGVLLATSPAASAAADPGKNSEDSTVVHAVGATPEVLALMRRQIPLDQAADRIEAAAGKTGSGLSGFVVDAENNTLHVYWHGALPAAINRMVATTNSARDFRIVVKAAPYTRDQLTAETDRIAASFMSDTGKPAITSVGPKADGTGLEVGVESQASGFAVLSASHVASALGTTIPIEVKAEAQPQQASRYGDTSPYYGGAYMEKWNADGTFGGSCSTGFSVDTTSLNGRIMISAAHCGGGIWENGLQHPGPDPQGRFLMGGSWPYDDVAHDTQLISMPSAPRIYDGGSVAGEAAQFSKPVKGAFGNRTGDRICTSGSYSGAVCGITVAATGQTINVGGFGTVRNTIRAEKDDRTAAVGNGDSGGPAFSLTTDASGVYARGTITAISSVQADWKTCRGVPNGPNSDPNARHCSWKFWYPDILVQMQEIGRLNNTTVTIATS
jgi:hypothetical protein